MNICLKPILTAILIFFVALLSGCGGGGGGSSGPSASILSGVASDGLLNGSTVCAYAITGGVASTTSLGTCATTSATGTYSINLGTYTGPVLLVATGGTYVDEATGATVTLASPLHTLVADASGSISVAITPLTELAYEMAGAASGGLTSTNIQAAITSVEGNFGVPDIINTLPVDAHNVPAGATTAQLDYTLALAMLSQYLNSQPNGTTPANVLQTLQACLASPTSSCGSGSTSLSTLLAAAMATFQTGHTAFSGIMLPLNNFGIVLSSSNTVTLTTVNPLPPATVGQAYSNTVVSSITPTSTYTYAIDTLASGNGTPPGMTLNMNGILSGMPFATGATDVNGNQIPHTYTFGVCAVDTVTRIATTPCPMTSIVINPVPDSVTVTLAGTGTGTVTSAPAGISCGATCSASFTAGSTVTLTANAASGSSFAGWSGGACTGTGSCVLTVNASKAVTATFNQSTNSGAPTASLVSSSCAPSNAYAGAATINYTLDVSGPIGTSIADMSSLGYFVINSCGAWTVDSANPGYCTRQSANPASTNVSFVSTAQIVTGGNWSVDWFGGASGYPNISGGTSVNCP